MTVSYQFWYLYLIKSPSRLPAWLWIETKIWILFLKNCSMLNINITKVWRKQHLSSVKYMNPDMKFLSNTGRIWTKLSTITKQFWSFTINFRQNYKPTFFNQRSCWSYLWGIKRRWRPDTRCMSSLWSGLLISSTRTPEHSGIWTLSFLWLTSSPEPYSMCHSVLVGNLLQLNYFKNIMGIN